MIDAAAYIPARAAAPSGLAAQAVHRERCSPAMAMNPAVTPATEGG
jgi:hypothetical protein